MKPATVVRRVALSIIGVFISVAVVTAGYQALAGPALAAPTITAKPANPALSTSASLSFTGPTGATFQCQLGPTSTFAACTSPKNYASLGQGAHTFRVKAVSGSAQSTATGYTWTVDTVAPPAPSITAKPLSLSKTTNPSFSFIDSEAGVAFRCTIDGSASACTSPRSYANLAQGLHTFGVQAVDGAGNRSAMTTWSWSIDSIPPQAPVLTTKPTDPTPNATNTFAWTVAAGNSYQCSVENGPWAVCSSPFTYLINTTSGQQHQFGVRAVDAAGNISAGTFYQYKYRKGLPTSGIAFRITGQVSALSIGVWKPIAVTIINPNNVVIFVNAINVAFANASLPVGCPSAVNFQLQQSTVSSVSRVAVPANGSVTLPAQSASAPQIRLVNLPNVNQELCKGTTINLSYSGLATN